MRFAGKAKCHAREQCAEKEQHSAKTFRMELLAYAVLAGAFLMLAWMNAFYLDNWIDSDMAAEMIFSDLLVEEGGFLATPNWYYSTEFRVLYTQLFMQPLLMIFKDWYVVRMITNLLTYVLLVGSYLYMVKPLKVRKHVSVLTAALLLLPFSETFATHVQMGNTYMPHMIIICFVTGMFFRLVSKEGKRVFRIFTGILYVLLCVICGLSGVRYLLAIQAPLVLAALKGVLKSDIWKEFRRKPDIGKGRELVAGREAGSFWCALLGAVSAVLGYGLNVIFVSSAFSFQTYEGTNFISVYQGIFLERVQNTLGSLLMLFGYIPDKGFVSVRGLITMIAFVLLGGILFVTVRTCRLLCAGRVLCKDGGVQAESAAQTSKAEPEPECRQLRRLLLWLFVSAFALNTFVFVFTNSTIVPRYYLTVFLFVPALFAIYLEEEKLPVDKFLICAGLCGCMVLTTAKTVYSYISTDKNQDKRAVAVFLQEEGYTFGYATYWNANIITELTDGEVEVANLYKARDLDEFHWSSPRKYYEEGYHTGKTFLLLTAEEVQVCADLPLVAEGNIVYEDEYYAVFHFESTEEFAGYATMGESGGE